MESIKCPQCGLVNFATAPECKRCHLSFESEPASSDSQYDDSWDQNAPNHYWPQGGPEQQTKQRVFSGGVVFLAVILGLATALFLMQHAFHPFDPDTAKGLGGVLGLVGVLLLLLTHIWLLIRIFEQSVGWGLASLFLPIVGLVAVIQFWEKTKRSFVGQMVCAGIVFMGIGIGV
ncbi:MAG TPA: hypothetical protein VN696_03895 [Pyrinomonadaceae bacterium]|nr:hypothetical protein [Pyrinomonadaceae bacterium]